MRADKESSWDVVVVGGGVAGLAAGAAASSAGASTLVLEAHQPGGRARVVEKDGYVFNMGGHALYRGGPGARALRALGVRTRGAKPPVARYHASRGGELHRLPATPGALAGTTLLSARGKAAFTAWLARTLATPAGRLAGTSAADWLATHELSPEVEEMAGALIRLTTYHYDLAVTGADAVVAQLQPGIRSGVEYLHGGWGPLLDDLASRTQVAAGAEVRTLSPADGAAGPGARSGGFELALADGRVLRAGAVVVATGAPAAVRALLPGDPGWGDLGEPVTAACLDLALRQVPRPGYVVGIDEPVYATLQGPPAHQAPEGHAVMAAIRYGARDKDSDRAELEAQVARAGVSVDDVVHSRFLARMVVAGTHTPAAAGGLSGRPAVDATGVAGLFVAGDWVGPEGILADAALASGTEAGRRAAQRARTGRTGASGTGPTRRRSSTRPAGELVS